MKFNKVLSHALSFAAGVVTGELHARYQQKEEDQGNEEEKEQAKLVRMVDELDPTITPGVIRGAIETLDADEQEWRARD